MSVEPTQIESVVAFIDNFLENDCFQFGWYEGKDLIRCVVGKDVYEASLPWERPINTTPDTKVWKALFIASLIKYGAQNICVAVGHPFSLTNKFQDLEIGKLRVVLPENGAEKTLNINVSEIMPVPECLAHALAYKQKLDSACLVISLGFGTVELGYADKQGIVHKNRLQSITYGLHQAANAFRLKVREIGYDDPSTRNRDQFHVFDNILQRVVDESEGKSTPTLNLIGADRSFKSNDLIDAANESLKEYGAKLSKRIVDYIKDQDLKDEMKVILTGGGVNYTILKDLIKEALAPFGYSILIADKDTAKKSAAIGLNIIANNIFEGQTFLGVDIGNHSVQAFIEQDHADDNAAMPLQANESLEVDHVH